MNRRSLLKNASLATAGLIISPFEVSSLLKLRSSESMINENQIRITNELTRCSPIDHGQALVNPGMGWALHYYDNSIRNYGSRLEPSNTVDYFPGLSVVYLRLPWSFIEPQKDKFAWETIDTPAQRWINKGKKIAFRITATESGMYYATPKWVFDNGAVGYDVDHLTLEPEYDDPLFLEYVERFVAAMADRYEGNPNVAFIDIGHYGMWGEGHTFFTTPKHGKSWGFETKKKHIDIYCRHFKKTLLCISDDYVGANVRNDRFPISDYAFSRGVTLRDDSILVDKSPNSWYHEKMAQLFWPTLPVIVESEHYGSSIQKGAWDGDLLVQSVEDYHASFLSIHWWPDEFLEKNRRFINRINLRLGYRLQLRQLEWPKKVRLGEAFVIRSQWRNDGVAPCYGGGYPCVTLKDKKGGIVSVMVDNQLNVKSLPVDQPDKATPSVLTSNFTIAFSHSDQQRNFSRVCHPGEYDLYVSVGQKDGTPLYELPYNDSDGKKRYKMGTMRVEN